MVCVLRWKTRGPVRVLSQCLVSEVVSSSTTTMTSSLTHSHQGAPSCTHSHQGAPNYTRQPTGVLGRCWETAAACLLILITGLREYLAHHCCIIHSDYWTPWVLGSSLLYHSFWLLDSVSTWLVTVVSFILIAGLCEYLARHCCIIHSDCWTL